MPPYVLALAMQSDSRYDPVMIQELITQRQALQAQLSQRRGELGPQCAVDAQVIEWKQQIVKLSSQIREINRATAYETARAELPDLVADADKIAWVHGHPVDGVPFAGRAVTGAFIINHASTRTRRGDRWNVQLYLNHRHMSQQMGAMRRTVELEAEEPYRVDEIEHILAQMIREVCRVWLVRHAHSDTDPSTVASSSATRGSV